MSYASDFTKLIGNTPIVAMDRLSKAMGCADGARVLAKLESFNPTGSVKDRAALKMIECAEADGRLLPGATIVEPTSGNTGIGLAAIAAMKGYKIVLTMPESMSEERKKLLSAYGAELVLTRASDGMDGAAARAKEIADKIPGAWIPDQFSNPANPSAHVETTAREIFEDTDGTVAAFVAGVGTGGTLCGTARGLKSRNPDIWVAAVEPAGSPLLSGGKAGAHGLQGIGANFVPGNYDRRLVDEVIDVCDGDAFNMCRRTVRTEGILIGISSGAALVGAYALARRPEFKNKSVVVVLPDDGMKYLSTGVY